MFKFITAVCLVIVTTTTTTTTTTRCNYFTSSSSSSVVGFAHGSITDATAKQKEEYDSSVTMHSFSSPSNNNNDNIVDFVNCVDTAASTTITTTDTTSTTTTTTTTIQEQQQKHEHKERFLPFTGTADFNWFIEYIDLMEHFGNSNYVNSELQMFYDINNQDYTIEILGINCSNDNNNETSITISSPTSGFKDSNQSTDVIKSLVVDIDVDTTTIGTSSYWSTNNDNNIGMIDFCVRVDLHLSDYAGTKGIESSVNFNEMMIKVIVDMEAGFSINDIQAEKHDAGYQDVADVDLGFTVYAYQCDAYDDRTSIQSVALVQGDLLQVCVSTNATDAYVSAIKELDLHQPDNGISKSSPIDNYVIDSLTDVDCPSAEHDGICAVVTQVMSTFFVSGPPQDLHVYGIAILAFGNPPSRRSERHHYDRLLGQQHDDNKNAKQEEKQYLRTVEVPIRFLQQDQQEPSSGIIQDDFSFDVVVQLQGGSNNDANPSTASITDGLQSKSDKNHLSSPSSSSRSATITSISLIKMKTILFMIVILSSFHNIVTTTLYY